jgi:prevent-host-death family protein
MATMTVADAKNHFSDVLRRAEYGGERVVVERHGKPVAAIVSTEDLRRLEAAEDSADVQDARAALAEAKEQGTVPLDAVLRKHGLAHLLVTPGPSKSESTGRRPRRARKVSLRSARKPARRASNRRRR